MELRFPNIKKATVKVHREPPDFDYTKQPTDYLTIISSDPNIIKESIRYYESGLYVWSQMSAVIDGNDFVITVPEAEDIVMEVGND